MARRQRTCLIDRPNKERGPGGSPALNPTAALAAVSCSRPVGTAHGWHLLSPPEVSALRYARREASADAVPPIHPSAAAAVFAGSDGKPRQTARSDHAVTSLRNPADLHRQGLSWATRRILYGRTEQMITAPFVGVTLRGSGESFR